jgi:multidrug efflux pump subunit AcrA (membrane-fusion protein)
MPDSPVDEHRQARPLRPRALAPVQRVLEEVCAAVAGVREAVVIDAAPGRAVSLAAWPAAAAGSAALLASAGAALEAGRTVVRAGPRPLPAERPSRQVALPLARDARPVGAIAFEIHESPGQPLADVLRALHAAVQPLAALLPADAGLPPSGSRPAAALGLYAALLEAADAGEAIAVLRGELVRMFPVEDVLVALAAEKGVLRLPDDVLGDGAAASHAPAAAALALDALTEALHQPGPVCFPPLPDEPPRLCVAHAAWARQAGGQVVGIALRRHARIVGAVGLRAAAGRLDAARIAELADVIALAAPALDLLCREARPWALLRARWRARFGPRRRWLAAGLAAALAGLLALPVPHRIAAPAQLEGLVEREVVAPVDGFIAAIHVRPGATVAAGQLLVELDDESLALERSKWLSELARHENAYAAALARADRTELVLNRSRIEEARAAVALVDERLAGTRLVAPFAGIVVDGDLDRAVGAPVDRGETLLKLSPPDGYRVRVEVDERDIDDLRLGARGELAIAGAPARPLALEVTRASPVATTREGRHWFDVEARLDGDVRGIRPGQRGVARLERDRRPLAVVLLRHPWQWLRLRLFGLGF